MNENEEIVYSAMGLDPILILEEPIIPENYTIHIIKTGEERGVEEVKNNKHSMHIQSNNPIEQDLKNDEEVGNTNEEGTKININLDEEKNELVSSDTISIDEKNELNSAEIKEIDEDPRRKRRRSSATS